MIPILRLELAKLIARRSVLYLLVPNLYTLFYTLALVLAVTTRSAGWTAFLGSLVTSSLALHPYVSVTAYPMCILMLCSELWGAEAHDRSLRTLILTQVPRGRLLAARVLVVTGVAVLSFLIYFALFFAHILVLEQVVPPEIWAKIGFGIGGGFANMAVYSGAFAVGLLALTLWITLIALIASRTSTVGMLVVMTLVTLSVGLPTAEEWMHPGSTWSHYAFTHAYLEVSGKEMLKSVLRGTTPWGDALGRATAVLGANALVLYGVCLAVFRRRQFVD